MQFVKFIILQTYIYTYTHILIYTYIFSMNEYIQEERVKKVFLKQACFLKWCHF